MQQPFSNYMFRYCCDYGNKMQRHLKSSFVITEFIVTFYHPISAIRQLSCEDCKTVHIRKGSYQIEIIVLKDYEID